MREITQHRKKLYSLLALSFLLYFLIPIKLVFLFITGFSFLILMSLMISISMLLKYLLAMKYHSKKLGEAMSLKKRRISKKKLYEQIQTQRVKITFVIPAYNEQSSIYRTIKAIATINYPRELVQIIAVNDCSTDRTFARMRSAKARFVTSNIIIINQKINQGKREGMMEGYRKATGTYVFFVDSDTLVEKNSVSKYLLEFSEDKNIASVTGMAKVRNENKNLITKMQALRYYSAFTIIKSSESAMGTVLCASGCSTMYKKEFLDTVMNEWYSQTFLGKPCTFGDDRSLTNFLIKNNYRTIYSDDTLCRTNVPETYKTYTKQQLRWRKSYTIEGIVASKFMYKKNLLISFNYYSSMFHNFLAPVIIIAILLKGLNSGFTTIEIYLLGLLLLNTAYGFMYILVEKKSIKNFILAPALFTLVNLSHIWLTPYAAVTLNNRKWGTR